ncbi:MAG TPA: hypothetical protein VE981_20295 [Planctomycetota bacterium]|nr:hypothetical protein [Planctomycetota bacterium]
MKHPAGLLMLLSFAAARTASAEDGTRWWPDPFKGNERYVYKMLMIDGEEKKESVSNLDVRKKGDGEWEGSTPSRNAVKAPKLGAEGTRTSSPSKG